MTICQDLSAKITTNNKANKKTKKSTSNSNSNSNKISKVKIAKEGPSWWSHSLKEKIKEGRYKFLISMWHHYHYIYVNKNHLKFISRLFTFRGILLVGILPRNILLRGIFLRRDFTGRDFSVEGFCKRDFPEEGFLAGGI